MGSAMELGPFLRSRRESVAPSEVGLPESPRRRTPGLRRAELATLAGISVDYLIRLEQSRDTRPSAQVLAALADALKLDDDDRDHLRRLAAISQGEELCPVAAPPAQTVRPTVRALLERLEPSPAFVLNGIGDVLAWTTAYDRLARPLGILDGDPPNVLRFTFTDRRAAVIYPDWETVADEQVANLRASARCGDAAGTALVEELSAVGVAFTRRLDTFVAATRSGMQRIEHPDVGQLRLSFESMQLADRDDQQLVVYLPADDATSHALDVLAGRQPGTLRAVKAG